jgi:hypothetical protein
MYCVNCGLINNTKYDECDECGKLIFTNINFCLNCGSKNIKDLTITDLIGFNGLKPVYETVPIGYVCEDCGYEQRM